MHRNGSLNCGYRLSMNLQFVLALVCCYSSISSKEDAIIYYQKLSYYTYQKTIHLENKCSPIQYRYTFPLSLIHFYLFNNASSTA